MLKIWGRISSLNVRKVVFAAQELGVAFERVDIGGPFGGTRTPAYLAMNPNALVPVIEDDQVQLWESNVIVRYLSARHGEGSMYPRALPARFEAERWMDWQQTTLNPAGRDAFVQLIRTPEAQRDRAVTDRSIAASLPLHDVLDQHLASHAFLAGDSLTMADLPIACEIHRWRALPIEQVARPHLDRWYASIRSRPSGAGVLDLVLT